MASYLTDKQIYDLIKYDGLMSRARLAKLVGISQAKANDFWRRYPFRDTHFVNGMDLEYAIELAPRCPYLLTDYDISTKLCLWVDIYDMINPRVSTSIKKSVEIMARFQIWVHRSSEQNIRETICQLMTEDL